jgi:diguanylate cyclase (GGDEF)-like protein
LARYGGEEFVLLLPQTSLDSAVILCEKLRKQIEAYPWHEIHADLHVTMSFGMSSDTSQGSLEKQLAIADNKLYEAKFNGRNCLAHERSR